MFFKIILLLIMTGAIIIKSKKNLHMLQQNLYNENNRYIKWVLNNSKNFITLELACLFLIAIANCFLATKNTIALIINIIVAILYSIYY